MGQINANSHWSVNQLQVGPTRIDIALGKKKKAYTNQSQGSYMYNSP